MPEEVIQQRRYLTVRRPDTHPSGPLFVEEDYRLTALPGVFFRVGHCSRFYWQMACSSCWMARWQEKTIVRNRRYTWGSQYRTPNRSAIKAWMRGRVHSSEGKLAATVPHLSRRANSYRMNLPKRTGWQSLLVQRPSCPSVFSFTAQRLRPAAVRLGLRNAFLQRLRSV